LPRKCEIASSIGPFLPYLKLDFSVTVNELKIGTVRGEEPGTLRSRRECDEYVEMQVA